MALETLFPANIGMQSAFSQSSIFFQLVIFSVVKIAILFSFLASLASANLKGKNRKALLVASSTEGLNFILKSLIVLNFLNLAAGLEELTGLGIDRIIFIPSILAMLFSIPLIKKIYNIKDGGAVFWYIWLTLGTIVLLLGDIALILTLLTS